MLILKIAFPKKELYYFQSYEWTPLHCASDSGHLEIVKYLIENGADVNAKNTITLRRMILFSKLWMGTSSLCFF